MKKGILAVGVILLVAAGMVRADGEGVAAAPADELHGAINVTYTSKYVWRGFDIFADKSAIHPGIDIDLYGTGFGISAVGHRANSDGFELGERWDYTLYYGNKLFESEPYATIYRVSWVYYNYPDYSSHNDDGIDLQELNAVLSWPNILGVKDLVPSYVLVKLWPSNSNSIVGCRSPSDGTASGFAHIFMLDYALPIEGLLPETAEQVLKLHSEVVYNDGIGPNGANVDHDWTNAVFGVSTDFTVCPDVTLTPGVYHQVTMDDSVNDDKDETWALVSLTYKF